MLGAVPRPGPQRKLVQRADMVEMDVGGHSDERLALRRIDLRRQWADAHAGVDQQVGIASPKMPDVRAHEIMHERFGQHRCAGVDDGLAEPVADDTFAAKTGAAKTVAHQTKGFPTLYFSGTSRFK